MCVCVCVCVRMCVSMNVYMYVYIYIYINTSKNNGGSIQSPSTNLETIQMFTRFKNNMQPCSL